MQAVNYVIIENLMFATILVVLLRLGLKSVLAWTALVVSVAAIGINLIAPLCGVAPGEYVLFCNDASFGMSLSAQNQYPQVFSGKWDDLNFLGNEGVTPSLHGSALIAMFFNLIAMFPVSPLCAAMLFGLIVMGCEHLFYWAACKWPPKSA